VCITKKRLCVVCPVTHSDEVLYGKKCKLFGRKWIMGLWGMSFALLTIKTLFMAKESP